MLEEVQNKLAQSVKRLFGMDVDPQVSVPEEQFGDIASNVAMQITKSVGKNPRDIAAQIAEDLGADADFSEVTVAGPGFLNIKLSDSLLIAAAKSGVPKKLAGKKVLVEYSDPNPFKPLHAGHLYTTLVGDAIARLVDQAGAETTRLNYGGDVGLHVAKSMWSIIQKLDSENPEKFEALPVEERLKWLGERYVEGNNAYEDDEQSKKEIMVVNKRVYKLHQDADKTSDFAKLYWLGREASYDFFKSLYAELQVHEFDRFIPESEVTPLGLQTVRDQLKAGVYERSDGAVIFDGDKHGLHKRVFINSEGLPTYEAKDVGLSLTKWQDYHFDESIIITASEQDQYMQVVIKSIEQFEPEPAKRTRHVKHGVVKLQGGVKMSSRKGNIVSAFDILEAARKASVNDNQQQGESTVLAAVKYSFLKQRIGGDIVYDPQESVAMDGNSGPYLQYAHARARSILGKSSASGSVDALNDLEAGERTLARKLTEYQGVMTTAIVELAPHHICTYLYELAQTFNRFYEKNRVIGDEREAGRLALVERYANTLKDGLGVLGIKAPDHM